MRMSMRRFTRLTNGSSKKRENHEHALALYFVYYNFCRISSDVAHDARNGSWRDRSCLESLRGYWIALN